MSQTSLKSALYAEQLTALNAINFNFGRRLAAGLTYEHRKQDAESAFENGDSEAGEELLERARVALGDADRFASKNQEAMAQYEVVRSQLRLHGDIEVVRASEDAWRAIIRGVSVTQEPGRRESDEAIYAAVERYVELARQYTGASTPRDLTAVVRTSEADCERKVADSLLT